MTTEPKKITLSQALEYIWKFLSLIVVPFMIWMATSIMSLQSEVTKIRVYLELCDVKKIEATVNVNSNRISVIESELKTHLRQDRYDSGDNK